MSLGRVIVLFVELIIYLSTLILLTLSVTHNLKSSLQNIL